MSGLVVPPGFDSSDAAILVLDSMVGLVLIGIVVTRQNMRQRLVAGGVFGSWLVLSYVGISILDGPFIGFELAAIRCGHEPVIASEFAASYSYQLPGDPDYKPAIFADTFFCSAAEAQAGGYNHLP